MRVLRPSAFTGQNSGLPPFGHARTHFLTLTFPHSTLVFLHRQRNDCYKKHQRYIWIMGNVFGKEKPLKEVLRENKRMINRAVRELDREKTSLEREEKRLTLEIKKAAKEQQMTAVKIMAKVSCGTRFVKCNYRHHLAIRTTIIEKEALIACQTPQKFHFQFII